MLPEDILRHICSFIPLRDLFRVELVCKRLHRLCWPSLRSIDFTRFRYILSDLIINYVFSKILIRRGQSFINWTVHKLIFPHTWSNSFTSLDKLRFFVNLEVLNTGSLRGIDSVQNLAKCVSLSSLELSDDLININYATALTSLTNLTRLYIPSFDRMSDVLSYLTNLRRLALGFSSTEQITFTSYLKLTTLRNLTHMKIELPFSTSNELFAVLFTALTNLCSLEINFAELTGSAVAVLSVLSALRYLSFEGCLAANISQFPFNALPNLYQLHLPKTFTFDDTPSFTACTALEVLNMNSVPGLADNLTMNPLLLRHLIDFTPSSIGDVSVEPSLVCIGREGNF